MCVCVCVYSISMRYRVVWYEDEPSSELLCSNGCLSPKLGTLFLLWLRFHFLLATISTAAKIAAISAPRIPAPRSHCQICWACSRYGVRYS